MILCKQPYVGIKHEMRNSVGSRGYMSSEIMSNEGCRVFLDVLQCVYSWGLDMGFDGPMICGRAVAWWWWQTCRVRSFAVSVSLLQAA